MALIGFVGGIVLAQEVKEPESLVPEVLPELPNPGLKPGDFFYFLDGWGESIREFFTFNPERKAILQTEQALERIAEINALLEIKGVDAPGLVVAEKKIQANMAKAVRILEQQKARGIEVARLAKRLEADFDIRQDLLESVFDLEEARLDVRKKEARLAIKEARVINDFDKLAESRIALENIKVQKQRLDVRGNDLTAILDIEEEKIELKMEAKERELDILEDEMEALFNERRREKEKGFEQKERALWLQEEALELQLRQAVLAEDTALIGEIKAKLIDLENQEQVIEQEQETAEIVLGQEERRKRGMVEMKERALEQIKDAQKEIFDIKEEIVEMLEDGEILEVPKAVLELIKQAESKLVIAGQAFEAGNYGKAFGQAMTAETLAIKAERILEEKEEVMEKLEELEEGLKQAGQTGEMLMEVQKKIELLPIEKREELKKEAEEFRQEFQEKLKEIEKEREKVKETIRKKERRERDRKQDLLPGFPSVIEDGRVCLTVITPAINPKTGQCIEFRDSCQVPEGWKPLRQGSCPQRQILR